MLRRFSVGAAAAALLGICALPVAATTAGAQATSGSFTVPSASSSVVAYGNYDIVNDASVKVTVCVKEVGNAFAVGAQADAYNANYSKHAALGAVVLPGTTGRLSCSTADLAYTSHLTVYSFLASSSGSITEKSQVKTVY
ncbi:MAG TPA: hypothetical protein VMD59_06640 [Acidimicrobiales bacterium]|nr:hypothetical protein [Acidimicrobiales bacterium]